MIPGHHTLASIEAETTRERQTVADLDRRLSEGSARLLEVGKAQTAAYRELARLRVGSLASGAVAAKLDAAEQQVSALLRGREATGKALADEIRSAEAKRASLQARRASQSAALEAAAAAVDAAEARTQARLGTEPPYQAQLQRAQECDRIAKHAAEKATRSEQELDAKGRAYRQDPLFMYLWRRHYGTPDYRGAPPFRWLDGKVARHARFAEARPDYGRLLEIPKRLREHATVSRQRADAELEALRELERKAREADGIPTLEAVELEQKRKRDALDQQLELLATEIQTLLDRRQQFAAGGDEPYRQAIDILAAGLRTEELQALRQESLATPFPEDDEAIARLLSLQQEQQRLETAAQELTAALEQHRDRLRQLEALGSEFKRRQYDQPGQGFQDGALVATVLANVIGGMLSRDALWRVLEQQRRFEPPRSNPTFGSGGFGRGSPWRGGGGPRGGGGGRGGGFRTGGKF